MGELLCSAFSGSRLEKRWMNAVDLFANEAHFMLKNVDGLDRLYNMSPFCSSITVPMIVDPHMETHHIKMINNPFP